MIQFVEKVRFGYNGLPHGLDQNPAAGRLERREESPWGDGRGRFWSPAVCPLFAAGVSLRVEVSCGGDHSNHDSCRVWEPAPFKFAFRGLLLTPRPRPEAAQPRQRRLLDRDGRVRVCGFSASEQPAPAAALGAGVRPRPRARGRSAAAVMESRSRSGLNSEAASVCSRPGGPGARPRQLERLEFKLVTL